MTEAKISDIFLSLQGEGLYLGVPQLFIRFYGCNLSCVFCDTILTSYRTFTRDALMSKILNFKEPYHSISLTGGEPLLQADFIKDFLEEYKKFYNKLIYLDTSGTLYKELSKVIDYVDIISMDFKLPSSTKRVSFWKEHRKFLTVAKEKKTFVKAVITSSTTSGDILRMIEIVKETASDIPIVLQPVTTSVDSERPTEDKLQRFKDLVKASTGRADIIPQMHNILGIK